MAISNRAPHAPHGGGVRGARADLGRLDRDVRLGDQADAEPRTVRPADGELARLPGDGQPVPGECVGGGI
jgi:hypothetical protein